MFERPDFCLFGLAFDDDSQAEALDRLEAAMALRSRCHLATSNVNFLRTSRSDPEFRDAVLADDLPGRAELLEVPAHFGRILSEAAAFAGGRRYVWLRADRRRRG